MKKFLNTPLASFLNVFVVAILVTIVKSENIYSLDWKNILNAAVLSTIPVIINYLNPSDSRYGINKS